MTSPDPALPPGPGDGHGPRPRPGGGARRCLCGRPLDECAVFQERVAAQRLDAFPLPADARDRSAAGRYEAGEGPRNAGHHDAGESR